MKKQGDCWIHKGWKITLNMGDRTLGKFVIIDPEDFGFEGSPDWITGYADTLKEACEMIAESIEAQEFYDEHYGQYED